MKANLKDVFHGYRKIARKTILKTFARCVYAPTKSEFGKWVQKFMIAGGEKATSFFFKILRMRDGLMRILKDIGMGT